MPDLWYNAPAVFFIGTRAWFRVRVPLSGHASLIGWDSRFHWRIGYPPKTGVLDGHRSVAYELLSAAENIRSERMLWRKSTTVFATTPCPNLVELRCLGLNIHSKCLVWESKPESYENQSAAITTGPYYLHTHTRHSPWNTTASFVEINID